VIAQFLSHNTTLTRLTIHNNKLENSGVRDFCEGLKKNETLEYLGLCGVQLEGVEGGKILKDMLSKNTSLTKLDLHGNRLGDEGVKAMFDGIESTFSLQEMNIWFNKFGEVGGKCVAGMLMKNTSLSAIGLGFNQIGNEGGEAFAQVISSSTSLHHLDIHDNGIGENTSEKIFCSLKKNTSLMSFTFFGNGVNGRCVEMLKENRYLVNVKLSRNADDYGWIMERNKDLWKKRMKWSCIVHVICRVVVVGGEWEGMAMEMIFHILQFIPPNHDNVLRYDEMRGILSFSTDIRTMGCDKMVFLERVFGKGIKCLLCEE